MSSVLSSQPPKLKIRCRQLYRKTPMSTVRGIDREKERERERERERESVCGVCVCVCVCVCSSSSSSMAHLTVKFRRTFTYRTTVIKVMTNF